jgi:hypothetical protein
MVCMTLRWRKDCEPSVPLATESVIRDRAEGAIDDSAQGTPARRRANEFIPA